MDENKQSAEKIASDIVERIFPKTVKSEVPKKNNNTDEINNLKKELELLKNENEHMKLISALEKSGCLRSELAAKAYPKDCKNIEEWVQTFKEENSILFKDPNVTHGGNYKPSLTRNLSPVEIMNNYIRGLN